MSKQRRNRRSKSHPRSSNNDGTDDDNWYSIRSISAERRSKKGKLEYLVEWEEPNLVTGKPYPPSWVPAEEVSSAAVSEWTEQKKKSLRVQTTSATLHQRGKRTRDSTSDSSPTRSDITSPRGAPHIHKKRRLQQRTSTSLGSPGLSVTGLSSAATDTPESDYPSQDWGGTDEEARNGRDSLVVEIRQGDEADRSEYLSVHLSSQLTQPSAASSQPSYYSLPSGHHSSAKTHSQRTVPDSQDLSNQGQPNQGPLSTIGLREDLSTVLGRPRLSPGHILSVPNSSSNSNSNSNSIPPHQTDPFRVIPDSQPRFLSGSATLPPQQSGSSQSPSKSRVADSQLDGSEGSPRFLTQAPFSLPPLTSCSSPNSRSTPGRESGTPSQSSQHQPTRLPSLRRPSANKATYTSESTPRFLSQQQFSLPPLATSVTPSDQGRRRLETGNLSGSLVPETVLRRPSPYRGSPTPRIENGWNFASILRTPQPPTRKPRQNINSSSPKRRSRAGATMSEDQPQPVSGKLSATEELLLAQRICYSQFSSLLGEEATGSSPEKGHPPPSTTAHDVDASVMQGIDDRPGHPSYAIGSVVETTPPVAADDALPPETGTFHPGGMMEPGATGRVDFATPATVALTEVITLPMPPAILDPSTEMSMSMELPYTSGRRLPHQVETSQDTEGVLESAPIMATDTDVAESSPSSDDEIEPVHGSLGGSIPAPMDIFTKEYTVTLPFRSSQRPLYLEKIQAATKDIDEFGAVFHNEVLRTPKSSLVYKIEELFLTLLDMCDYPAGLEWSSLQKMTDKEKQKYAVETNAKFAFIWDLLNELKETPSRVLIIARSEKLLFYLESLVGAEGYAFSRQSLDQMKDSKSKFDLRVVLATPGQQLAEKASDFDVVIGYDFEFKQSAMAREIASLTDSSRLPFVFSLVLTHSIEHLDLQILRKHPGIDELDRKNALLITMWRMMPYIQNPQDIYWKPYPIARQLAGLVKDPREEVMWRPTEVSEDILDFYLDSSQPKEASSSNEESGGDDRSSRKRKLADSEDAVRKRRKIALGHQPVVDARRHAALAPFIRILGVDVLNDTTIDLTLDTTVPVSLLRGIEWKMEELQRALDDSKGHVKDLRRHITAMETQNTDYKKSVNTIYLRHREAMEERGKFQYQYDVAVEEKDKLKKSLAASKEENDLLKAKIAKLEADAKRVPDELAEPRVVGLDSAEDGHPHPTGLEKALEEARAGVAELKKKNEATENTLEYTRKAYQDASQAAGELSVENLDLKTKVQELEGLASDSLRRIHEINTQNQVKELVHMLDEKNQTSHERDVQLDRAIKELGLLKNGRRETRQASVPRSPRMGMMSPRPGRGIGGSASRGTSPAPLLEAALPAGMSYNGGRWGHLRD